MNKKQIEALSAAAAVLGRKGGQAKSGVKTEAARKNAKKGGRPRKTPAGWNIERREDGRLVTWVATKREADRLCRGLLAPASPFTYRAVRAVRVVAK